MDPDLENTYDRLYSYCERQDFAGHDPFDGLNSKIFQATPLKNSGLARRIMQQAVKRSPVDLRSVLAIKKGVNPKALALFTLAELARFRTSREVRHLENASELANHLLGQG